jgi:hypothetical protein
VLFKLKNPYGAIAKKMCSNLAQGVRQKCILTQRRSRAKFVLNAFHFAFSATLGEKSTICKTVVRTLHHQKRLLG